jgi:hypothetical protein
MFHLTRQPELSEPVRQREVAAKRHTRYTRHKPLWRKASSGWRLFPATRHPQAQNATPQPNATLAG